MIYTFVPFHDNNRWTNSHQEVVIEKIIEDSIGKGLEGIVGVRQSVRGQVTESILAVIYQTV